MVRTLNKLTQKLGFDHAYRSFFKQALVLALPIAGQRVVSVSVNLLDNLMVGSLGDTAISACSIANQFFLLFSCVTGGVIGGAVLIGTQAWGNRDGTTLKKMMSAAVWLTLFTSAVFMVFSLRLPEDIIGIYTDKSILFAPGGAYLRIIALSFIPFALTSTITMMLQAVGCVKLGFYIECVNSVTNAVLNWVLIFGNLGAPRMGLEGAAIATVIARVVGLVIALVYLFAVDKQMGFRLRNLVQLPEAALWKVYLKCGFPILVGDSLLMLNSMFQTMITGRISDVYIAANSIVHVIWQIAVLTGMGFERAANIMIGGDIGSGDLERAQKNGDRFFRLSILQGAVSAALVLMIGPLLLPFYKVSPEATYTARTMLRSASVVVFVMAVQMITTRGVIRAGGKTRQLMTMDLLSCFCFGLPLGYIAAFLLNWPPYAIYIVIRGDYLIKALWGIVKLKRGTWIERLVT